MKYDAFNPKTALFNVAAATTAPTPVQLFAPTTAQIAAGVTAHDSVEISNPGTVDAFLCYATTSAGATTIATAGIPAAAASQAGMLHIPAGSDKIYNLRSDLFFTALTASGTTTCWLVAGAGL
jgi:hypothetical protein